MTPFETVDHDRLRSGHGVKWGSLPRDVLGAWVADMDFGVPPAVRASVVELAEREDFGYPFWRGQDPVVTAFEERMVDRHGWSPIPDRTRVFTDLIQVLQVVIEHTTAPGDGIALHVPTYPPFLASIARSGRRIVPLPMRWTPSGWDFSTDALADRLQGCKLLVLVNPHNPTGRVFTRAELAPLADVAEELDLVVLADEIHADLAHSPHRHVPFATLAPHRTITATSATKAFNIAGLRCAVAHIGPDATWDALSRAPLDYFGTPSTVSRVATVAAWRDSRPWLDELSEVLRHNRSTVERWAADLPWDLRHHAPEASYLSWFDFADTPLRDVTRLEREARVKLSEGAEFASFTDVDTSTFARLNFATSPSTLAEILDRIGGALT